MARPSAGRECGSWWFSSEVMACGRRGSSGRRGCRWRRLDSLVRSARHDPGLGFDFPLKADGLRAIILPGEHRAHPKRRKVIRIQVILPEEHVIYTEGEPHSEAALLVSHHEEEPGRI